MERIRASDGVGSVRREHIQVAGKGRGVKGIWW